MRKNDFLYLKTEKMINNGFCLARYNGKIVLVNKCLPEEEVLAKIVKVRRDYIEAEAIEIIESSKYRIEPKCKYFGLCGGCKLQDILYEKQLEIKKEFVNDDFIRIGKIQDVEIPLPIPSKHDYFYRNKMEYSFGKRWLFTNSEYNEQEKKFALGLHIPGQFEKVIHLDKCYLQSEFSNNIRNYIGDYLFERGVKIHSLKEREGLLKALVVRESYHTQEKMINLITTKYDENLMVNLANKIKAKFPEVTTFVNSISDSKISSTISNESIVVFGKGYIIEKLFGYEFEIYPNTFFQTNTPQAENLFSLIRNDLSKDTAKNSSSNRILIDLYSGVGVLCIILSEFFDKVLCFEEVEQSIISAKRNAQRNNVKNIKFIKQNLLDGFELDESFFNKEKVIIIDPPRAGLSKNVIQQIKTLKPVKIYYISCNPATQARDIAYLIEHYKISAVQPVDMFPQTYHIENFIILEKK